MGRIGLPPDYDNPQDMQKKIDEYFDNIKKDKDVLTITGLALALGFCSRQSIYDYEKKPAFTYTIKKARMRIEQDYERSLRKTGRSGDIFALKNFGWRDKQEIEQNVNSNVKIDLTKLNDKELEKLNELTAKLSG